MSLYKGSTLIAGGRQSMPLLSFMWADHQLNDMSWLRADTFSWQSGSVYKAAYQHLVKDICAQYWGTNPDGTGLVVFTKALEEISIGSSVYDTDLTTVLGTITAIDTVNNTITVSSDNPSINTTFYNGGLHPTTLTQSIWETINGITIRSFIASDGHKICLADEETDIDAVYNATGVAWYYILDTTNQRFKLPRSKYGFVGMRDGVGNYVSESLPNITGTLGLNGTWSTASGAFTSAGSGNEPHGWDGKHSTKVTFTLNASRSSPTYQNNAPVQQRATQMYLYFYVGGFTQTAIENTAGLNAEMFNDLNAHKVIDFQEPTSENNYTWYRLYADGWVEQGGTTSIPSTQNSWTTTTVNLLVTMQSGYSAYVGNETLTSGAYGAGTRIEKNPSNIIIHSYNCNGECSWRVSGMAA